MTTFTYTVIDAEDKNIKGTFSCAATLREDDWFHFHGAIRYITKVVWQEGTTALLYTTFE